MALLDRDLVVAPDADAQAIRALDDLLSHQGPVEAALVGPRGERLSLPRPVYTLLRRIVHELARGNAVTIAPFQTELTTQQAADLLNVSRPFLIRNLLDTGEIPFHHVGTHRRVHLHDVLSYRHRRGQIRRDALREMLREAQEMGLYEMDDQIPDDSKTA